MIKIQLGSNKLSIFWSSTVKTGEKKEEKQIWLAVRNNSVMQILVCGVFKGFYPILFRVLSVWNYDLVARFHVAGN